MESNKIEKFWAKIDKSPGYGPNGDCWIWTGAISSGRYGRFSYRDENKKSTGASAHRFAYCLDKNISVKDLSSDLLVCHTCDNPPCVNPAHLFLGTSQDNADDKMSKNRQIKGSKHGNSKINENTVRIIKMLSVSGIWTYEELGIICGGLNKSNIMRILRGDSWKHVE